jgi:hypothetical protein
MDEVAKECGITNTVCMKDSSYCTSLGSMWQIARMTTVEGDSGEIGQCSLKFAKGNIVTKVMYNFCQCKTPCGCKTASGEIGEAFKSSFVTKTIAVDEAALSKERNGIQDSVQVQYQAYLNLRSFFSDSVTIKKCPNLKKAKAGNSKPPAWTKPPLYAHAAYPPPCHKDAITDPGKKLIGKWRGNGKGLLQALVNNAFERRQGLERLGWSFHLQNVKKCPAADPKCVVPQYKFDVKRKSRVMGTGWLGIGVPDAKCKAKYDLDLSSATSIVIWPASQQLRESRRLVARHRAKTRRRFA